MEEGFIYFNLHLKPKPSTTGGPALRQKNKLVELPNPDPRLTLSASPGMSFGPVSWIFGLPSSSVHQELQHLPLKDLVRLRLEKRLNPTYESLEQFFKIRSSCHIVEEINNEFFCDCAQGIKGHLCKHTMALTFDRTDFPVDPRLNAVKFKRRQRGRPKSIGLALTREPEAEPAGGEEQDAEPGGGRGGGAMPRGARGRGRGSRVARSRGRGKGARGRGGQPGGSSGEGALPGGQEGSAVIPGNLWSSMPTIVGPVHVDGGVLRLQITDGGASQEEEVASSQEEEEAGTNSQEDTAEELDLELDL